MIAVTALFSLGILIYAVLRIADYASMWAAIK